jgi:hypothetical protein
MPTFLLYFQQLVFFKSRQIQSFFQWSFDSFLPPFRTVSDLFEAVFIDFNCLWVNGEKPMDQNVIFFKLSLKRRIFRQFKKERI